MGRLEALVGQSATKSEEVHGARCENPQQQLLLRYGEEEKRALCHLAAGMEPCGKLLQSW